MIEIKLTVTPEQLVDIAAVMAGSYTAPKPVSTTSAPTADDDAVVQDIEEYGPPMHPNCPSVMVPMVDGEQPVAPKPACGATPAMDAVVPPAEDSTDADAIEQGTIAAPAGVDLDADGYPWDMRIHASTKTKNADGRWKARRKPGDMEPDAWAAEIKSVQEELKRTMSAEPPKSLFADVPPPPAVEVPADIPPPPATGSGEPISTFPQLLPVVSSNKASGKITDDQIASACAAVGLTKFGELATRPDLIPQFATALGV